MALVRAGVIVKVGNGPQVVVQGFLDERIAAQAVAAAIEQAIEKSMPVSALQNTVMRMDDWSSRIKQLERAGWTLVGIGREIGMSTGAVSDIKNGRSSEPRGMAAVRLYELAEREAAKAQQPTQSEAA